MLGTIKNSME